MRNSLWKKGLVVGILVLFIVIRVPTSARSEVLSKANLQSFDDTNISINLNGYVNNLTTTDDFSHLEGMASSDTNYDGCAGCIATGTVSNTTEASFGKIDIVLVKTINHTIFQGTNYTYYGIQSCMMGMNEKGVAVGNFGVGAVVVSYRAGVVTYTNVT